MFSHPRSQQLQPSQHKPIHLHISRPLPPNPPILMSFHPLLPRSVQNKSYPSLNSLDLFNYFLILSTDRLLHLIHQSFHPHSSTHLFHFFPLISSPLLPFFIHSQSPTFKMAAYTGKDANRPKRPQSAYFLWLADFRVKVRVTNGRARLDGRKDSLGWSGEEGEW